MKQVKSFSATEVEILDRKVNEWLKAGDYHLIIGEIRFSTTYRGNPHDDVIYSTQITYEPRR